MSQRAFAEAEFENKKHKARREVFFWNGWTADSLARFEKRITHYPKNENGPAAVSVGGLQKPHGFALELGEKSDACPSDTALEDAPHIVMSETRNDSL